MKYSFFLSLVVLFLIGCGKLSEKQNLKIQIEKNGIDTLNVVKKIEKYKAMVEASKMQLKNIQRDLYESSEGGVVKVYYKGADTLKKEIIYYGEGGKKTVDIYQKDGKFILIEDKDIVYKNPIYVNSDVKVSDSTMNVFYLDSKQKLIFWLQNGERVSTSKYKKKEEEITLDYD
ncbi:hypothetical protein H4K35_03945 [Myroides sp. NP-2]|uniref:hypothetical protein n=1 Tax=Myroides sp. NP-2 TaxID=2759945 RepID=UPI0015F8A94C|nr:hypothetical protein [Myroides sp. NP-2]MBB1149292.1 hypothetical protein [Myroides sp. NP-2]